jgi:hypothetical protein
MLPRDFYASCFKNKTIENLYTEENEKLYEQFETTKKNMKKKENGELLACTPPQFVHYFTDPSNSGKTFHNLQIDYHEFMKKFLLIYDSFMTGNELLKLLRLKYNTPPPLIYDSVDLTEEEFETFNEKELSVIRLRFLKFFFKFQESLNFAFYGFLVTSFLLTWWKK